MMKLCVFIGLLLVVVVTNANTVKVATVAEKIVPSKDLAVEVIIAKGKKLANILEKYPNAVEMKRTTKKGTAQINGRGQNFFEYSIGGRVFGDYIVSQASDNIGFYEPSDVSLRLEYPAHGTGAIVTYVSIMVDQSSPYGRAYVVSGGIGYRYISIVIEAEYTYWFEYHATIFGY